MHAEGEVLQYTLGTVGPPGWRLLQAPIGGSVAPGDRITPGGNGRLDTPARLYAIVTRFLLTRTQAWRKPVTV